MTGRGYDYVYGGTVAFGGTTRTVDGTAWCPQRCDETRLRAVILNDVARDKGVPLVEIEIRDFWYSEIVPGDSESVPRANVDPFRPYAAGEDSVDPFRPGPGHPCTGDA